MQGDRLTAKAVLRKIRVSPRKLNLLAKQIRGLQVQKALDILSFSPKKASIDVKKTLMSAIANAENNHNLDIDRLSVAKAIVGQAFALNRYRPRAKGRAAPIKKYFSHLTIEVKEQEV
ncbi:MAG: 50S ribosomal protein L22 [Proteobacteria bacterium]|nr:50S ribosomal protein L22 [Pseudomonadota bacterium]